MTGTVLLLDMDSRRQDGDGRWRRTMPVNELDGPLPHLGDTLGWDWWLWEEPFGMKARNAVFVGQCAWGLIGSDPYWRPHRNRVCRSDMTFSSREQRSNGGGHRQHSLARSTPVTLNQWHRQDSDIYCHVKTTFLLIFNLKGTRWYQKYGDSCALSQCNYYAYTSVLKVWLCQCIVRLLLNCMQKINFTVPMAYFRAVEYSLRWRVHWRRKLINWVNVCNIKDT